ncbi:tRNA modification GTPase [Aestuariibaculum sp. YM273]|uniref:tRNA modification GTPase n=1 Tax=Aestuariibaculum sp. YM273 TaxID=3070659 RepID=UPI0027DE53FC|nr:tRNA modification GTPase [Aestuariibaculum sp. YM273]WMI65357.1 tRNA modification GTPase [Aestuariibaculum sp. YM273]
MKIKLILILLILFPLQFKCYSQILFEKGYFINNENKRTNCFIKNEDWKNNPSVFYYKLSENHKIQEIGINSIKEFGINNTSKYLRSKVQIDRSSNQFDKISQEKTPNFIEETIFLKFLIEGSANLYKYEDGNLIRFFYNVENSKIEQLVYKPYKTNNNRIAKNNRFRNQLWNDLKCADIEINNVEKLGYYQKQLTNFFVEYNTCKNGAFINYEEKQKRDLFNLNLRLGLNNSNLFMENTSASYYSKIRYNEKVTFKLGVEAEVLMPFFKNKWALTIEPTYQYFKSQAKSSSYIIDVDYKSIEVPVGIRHYFFLNKKSKIFINGSFVFDASLKSTIDFNTSSSPNLKIKSRNNIAFGLGFKLNDRYSCELRYQTPRDILSNYMFWNSEFQSLAFSLGYTLL